MAEAQLLTIAGDALLLVLVLAAPPLLSALAAGFVMGLLQGATQIQDSALSFVPKLTAAVIALMVSAGFMREQLVTFARDVLRACG